VTDTRASDGDREHTVVLLREHVVQGRLTLEEFAERISGAYAARTNAELEGLVGDLPATVVSRRRPTRLVLSVLGSSTREGRICIRRRIVCLMGFGNIDLDLRQATLEGDTITIVAIGVVGAIDVYVPEGVEIDLHGFAFGGHRRARGNDPPPEPGTPLVHIVAFSFFAGVDVWRVPIAWASRSWREVVGGIRSGAHHELDA